MTKLLEEEAKFK
jgi:hypothetical protein